MRKLLLIAAVVALVCLASCKGNYTCTCVDHHGAVLGTYPYSTATHHDAKNSCEGQEVAWQGVDPQAKCTLSK